MELLVTKETGESLTFRTNELILFRYYDKHMFFFTEGGSAGCILEHTSIDGLTMYRMLRETFTDMTSTPVLNEAVRPLSSRLSHPE